MKTSVFRALRTAALGCRRAACCIVAMGAAAQADAPSAPGLRIRPTLGTQAVPDDADDPAIWVHPSQPGRSLILGTNKVEFPKGALHVFGMDGRTRQVIKNLDRPNNVDVEYGLTLGGRKVDIAVVTERLKSRLRIYAIERPSGRLKEIGAPGETQVFEGEMGERAAPMGIGLYRRPRDGAIFAIVSRKEGPAEGYVWQYRLSDNGSGRVRADWVRAFGRFSGKQEIEAVAVDDELGYVYYSDERSGVRKYRADPDHRDGDRELAFFARSGWKGDHEGIAIYPTGRGKGYLLCTDQIAGGSRFAVYRREGGPDGPHDHLLPLAALEGGSDDTDGIEATAQALGTRYPRGALVAMDSRDRRFLVYNASGWLRALKDRPGPTPSRF